MINLWPTQDYNSMVKYFGNVGENQTQLTLPYPMKLAWNPKQVVTRITCHEKVHDSLLRILTAMHDYYGGVAKLSELRLDLFGGCLNVRRVRGGTNWSIHSWGCAIDLDPDHNTMKMHRNQATMPKEVIDIFSAEGWTSMGDSRNYDFMHFQAARL